MVLIQKYLAFKIKPWKNLKISRRIFYTFIITLVCALLLTIVNFYYITKISKTNQNILQIDQSQNVMVEFEYILKTTQDKIKNLMQLVEMATTDPDLSYSIVININKIETLNKELTGLIGKFAPEDLNSFQGFIRELAQNCRQWSNEKSALNLINVDNSLKNLQFLMDNLTENLNRKIELDLKESEQQVNTIRISSLVFNLVIVLLLAIIIFPLLQELKVVFSTVRQASENSLEGATNALNYTANVDGLIIQLENVIHDMGKAIADVAESANDTAAQAGSIIAGVKNATDLVGELAEKALQIYENLNSNQSHLQYQAGQIQDLSGNITDSLMKINSNADMAEKLTSQLIMLQQELAGISSFLSEMTEINEQTNLLALNANIEAAKAGTYGKGFGVVAERIRQLSDKTEEFTGEIQSTIIRIQKVTNGVESSLKEVINNLRGSTTEVSGINREFSKLKQVLEALYTANEKVIKAADFQFEKTKLIYRDTQDIMTSVENISAQTEEVSSAMEELAAESQEIGGQIVLIGSNVSDTKSVAELQVDLAKMVKETVSHF